MPLSLHAKGRTSIDAAAPEGRREELLLEIGAWIGRVGVVGFSLRAAAKAVGVSAPTLLRHFGSKEGLLAELAALNGKNDLESLRSAVAEAGSLRGALELAATKPVLVPQERVRLYLQLMALQGSELFATSRKAKALATVKVLTRMMTDEGVPAREASEIAHFMSASSVGFLSSYALFQDAAQLQQNYRKLYSTVAQWMKQSARGALRAA